VRREVEVGAVGDPLELAPLAAGEVEAVLDVDGALGVVRQLLGRVLVDAQVVGVDAEVGVPAQPLVDPVLVPLLVLAGLDEELHLHLLELAGAEDEVAGRDLVAEALAGLGDAERRLLARGLADVEEVDEDALGGLGAQVVQARLVLDDAEIGLEHHVEVARLGPLAAGAAVGAGDVGERQGVGVDLLALLGLAVGDGLLQVVDPEALVAALALGERVGELADVARGDPGLARQDDRRVEPDDVLTGGDHRAPPLPLDVLLELDAQRAVVPRRARSAVDLTAREHEPATLAEGDDGVDDGGGGGHARKAIRAATARPNRSCPRTARRGPCGRWRTDAGPRHPATAPPGPPSRRRSG
jgi:hypothetical protein